MDQHCLHSETQQPIKQAEPSLEKQSQRNNTSEIEHSELQDVNAIQQSSDNIEKADQNNAEKLRDTKKSGSTITDLVKSEDEEQIFKFEEECKEGPSKKRDLKDKSKKERKKAKDYKRSRKKPGPKKMKNKLDINEVQDRDYHEQIEKDLNFLKPHLCHEKPKEIIELSKIDDRTSVAKYLQKSRWFIIDRKKAHNKAKKSKCLKDVEIQIFVESTKRHYMVKPSAIFNYLESEQKIIFTKYLRVRMSHLKDIPDEIKRYTNAYGAAPLQGRPTRTDKNATAGTGYYTYQKDLPKVQVYCPQNIFKHDWFFYGPQDQSHNDCLVHAINYMLRYPYFVSREQVIRLICKKKKYGNSKAVEQKGKIGIMIDVFKDFAIKDNKILSLQQIAHFSPQTNNSQQIGSQKEIEELLLSRKHSELLVASISRFGSYVHALAIITLKNQDQDIVALDSRTSEKEYLNTVKPPKRQFDFTAFFLDNLIVSVYKLEMREPKDNFEKENLDRQLRGIMTGDNSEVLKARETQRLKGFQASHNKRGHK